ncbi:hypothetical protein AK812_SmicGene24152 [Symbiodinium microadriaticum]|uniref:Uncharacterized protein n=1 Tax=Symbiodinium microadriaticum TaxID=2951 RepID=A0A1Q9DFA7_SYMMI|nr:hypothetical protein AK812_SmicGene24152 [Symbiodinium microadriaticum]
MAPTYPQTEGTGYQNGQCFKIFSSSTRETGRSAVVVATVSVLIILIMQHLDRKPLATVDRTSRILLRFPDAGYVDYGDDSGYYCYGEYALRSAGMVASYMRHRNADPATAKALAELEAQRREHEENGTLLTAQGDAREAYKRQGLMDTEEGAALLCNMGYAVLQAGRAGDAVSLYEARVMHAGIRVMLLALPVHLLQQLPCQMSQSRVFEAFGRKYDKLIGNWRSL